MTSHWLHGCLSKFSWSPLLSCFSLWILAGINTEYIITFKTFVWCSHEHTCIHTQYPWICKKWYLMGFVYWCILSSRPAIWFLINMCWRKEKKEEKEEENNGGGREEGNIGRRATEWWQRLLSLVTLTQRPAWLHFCSQIPYSMCSFLLTSFECVPLVVKWTFTTAGIMCDHGAFKDSFILGNSNRNHLHFKFSLSFMGEQITWWPQGCHKSITENAGLSSKGR